MEKEYYTMAGDRVSPEEIRQAVRDGRAVIVWSHGNWYNSAGLRIYRTREGAELAETHFQTVGQCYSMWDETWTERPTEQTALQAAAGALKTS